MIIKDKIEYNNIYETFIENVEKLKKDHRKSTIESVLCTIISIILFTLLILCISKFEGFSDEETIEEVLNLLCSIFLMFATIICAGIVIFKIIDSIDTKEYVKKADIIMHKDINVKEKILEIEKEFTAYYIDYIAPSRLLNSIDFVNYKILKAFYTLDDSRFLNITYVKDNEVLTEKIHCNLRTLEKLDAPRIDLTSNGLVLNIKYTPDLPSKIDFSNETWEFCESFQ